MNSIVNSVIGKAMSVGKIQAQLELASRRDIPDMLHLYYKEGWVDYSHDDLAYLFLSSSQSCFKLMAKGQMVGLSIATQAGNGVCYPHSNLIYSEYRDKVNYFDEALKYSQYLQQITQLQVTYAAKQVVRMYQSGGRFKPLDQYRRVTIKKALSNTAAQGVFEVTGDAWRKVHAYSQDVYKVSREVLFAHFAEAGARGFAVADQSGEIVAFCMLRDLPKGKSLGPVIAETPALARQVMAGAIGLAGTEQLIAEGEERKLLSTLDGHFDFTVEDNVMVKMYRGDAALLEDESRLFTIFSRYIS